MTLNVMVQFVCNCLDSEMRCNSVDAALGGGAGRALRHVVLPGPGLRLEVHPQQVGVGGGAAAAGRAVRLEPKPELHMVGQLFTGRSLGRKSLSKPRTVALLIAGDLCGPFLMFV